jgi:Fur family transcriptional regulator, zinc uptake regulator
MTETGELTRNQSLVLDRLTHAEGPMSAYDILGELRVEGIKAPLQVYRALDKLLEKGLAHRLESLNAFVVCAEPHCHSHGLIAFAICENCGRVDEFADDVVRERLDLWTRTEAFTPRRTTVEIRGVCAGCSAA